MKKSILYILLPIVIAILSYFVFFNYIFYIPDPNSTKCIPETYYFSFIFAFFVLCVSSIISAILYVGNKRNKADF